jgi:hypothetical protein
VHAENISERPTTPVIKHGNFVLFFYSILINVCEIDVRESASDCTLASGEGLGSGGETSHPISL